MARSRTAGRRRTPPRRRGILRRALRALGILAALVLLVLGGLAAAVVETRPRVVNERPADGAAAGSALEVYRSARAALLDGEAHTWRITEEEINDAFAAAARMRQGVAGRAIVDENGLFVRTSLPIPRTGLWINADAGVAASERGVVLTEARLGRLPLPPRAAESAARMVLDIAIGAGAGRALFRAVEAVQTDPPAVTVTLSAPDAERRALTAQLRQLVRDRAGAEDEERVLAHLAALERARSQSLLPEGGSLVHHLRFVLMEAAARAEAEGSGGTSAELRAGLFAIALTCGDRRFAMVIGIDRPGGENSCSGIRLLGRPDLRQHFAVSAGLAAATTLGEAHGIGELKELYDSDGGSGFSFDDMAANLAGTRFALEALDREPAEWRRIAETLTEEDDIMPEIADLPVHLSEDEFRRRFGDVESPEYQAMLREIERRIDALPLHRAAAG